MSKDYEFNPPIGIDLGTTYSVIAKWNGSRAEHYRTGAVMTQSTFQSVVWYDEKNDKYLTDRLAYKKTLVDPEHGIVGVKRHMDNRNMVIKLGEKEHSPMEISAMIIKGMYDSVAGMYLKGQFESEKVVVTVPYYFKAHQCANTREAVELAGLECVGVLQEPIAASLQYVLNLIEERPNDDFDEVMLVFDLGGGTFDLTLFNLKVRQDKLIFEVIASGGDDRLGGLDFDNALVEYVLKEEGISIDKDADRTGRMAWQKIMAACVDLKEALSTMDSEQLIVPYATEDKHIQRTVTRDEFESCISGYIDKVAGHIDKLFEVAGISRSKVTRVIKVGGSSKIPAMDKMLVDKIGADVIYRNIDDALCVAEGAAIYAAYLDDPTTFGRTVEICARSAHALGIEIDGGEFFELIPANSKTPCSRSQVFVPSIPHQKMIDLNVYQGSGKIAKENTKIGSIQLDIAIDDEPEPDIKVFFNQDEWQNLVVKVQIGDSEYTQGFITT